MKHNELKWLRIRFSQTIRFTSLELIALFQIPIGKHLVIENILYNFTASGNGSLEWDEPFSVNTEETDVGGDERGEMDAIWIWSVAADTMHQLTDLGIHIWDELLWNEDTNLTVFFSFGHRFADGPMKLRDDQAELLEDARKIGMPQTSEGGAFDITGDFKQLGIDN